MKRTVVVFGLISAVIIASVVWLMLALVGDEGEVISIDNSHFVGYGIMVIALSVIFFGIKSFRDNQAGGRITFWKGLQIGLLITLISSIGYGSAWTVHNQMNPEWLGRFMQKYNDYQADKMRAGGSSQEEIDASTKEMTEMGKMLENPLVFFLIALGEIVPVGIVISLISAGLLRKKEFLPEGGEIPAVS